VRRTRRCVATRPRFRKRASSPDCATAQIACQPVVAEQRQAVYVISALAADAAPSSPDHVESVGKCHYYDPSRVKENYGQAQLRPSEEAARRGSSQEARGEAAASSAEEGRFAAARQIVCSSPARGPSRYERTTIPRNGFLRLTRRKDSSAARPTRSGAQPPAGLPHSFSPKPLSSWRSRSRWPVYIACTSSSSTSRASALVVF
jgi:hypothetical protein